MHYLLKLVVKGENEKEAMANALDDAEELVNRGDYDWFTMDGRWGESKPYRVNSETGKQHIEDGMSAHRRDFDSAMKHIRYMMDNYSDDDIYNENFGDYRGKLPEDVWYLSKWQFYGASGDKNGPYVYALDGNIWGGYLEKEGDVKHVMDKDSDSNKLWVVPVDFHN